MTKEQIKLAKEYEGDIINIEKALNVLGKPMLEVYSKWTGSSFEFNDFSEETCCILKTVIRETLETRKQELKEKLERL